MKIDTASPILDLTGQPLIEDDKPVTIAMLCINALLSPLPREVPSSAEQKVAWFSLALRINDGGTIDLKAEEVSDLKAQIARLYPPLLVGRAFQILDPRTDA